MKALRSTLGPAFLAFAIALVIASAALVVSGHNPLTAYQAMWANVDGSVGLANIVNKGAQLYVAALAVAIGFKMNLFNIGANGQIAMAAMAAGAVGAAVSLPPVLHVAVILVTAIVVGALWAGVAGVLKVTRNVHEVIATIMLNGIGVGIVGYLLKVYFKDRTDLQATHTRELHRSALLPTLNRVFGAVGIHLAPGANVWSFVLIATTCGIGFYVLIFRTRFGFDLRASGINASAARTSGVHPSRMVVTTMLISGALAGLAGMATLLQEQFEYGDRFPKVLGFTAIGIALLGRNHPVGIAFASFVWSAIEQGSRALAGVGVPSEIGQLLQAVLLFVAVIVYEVMRRRNEVVVVREAAARTAATHAAAVPG